VERNWGSPPAAVMATPRFDAKVWITEKDDKGFKINISLPPGNDETIDWFAIW